MRAGPGRWWWFAGLSLVAHVAAADPLISTSRGELDLATGTMPCDPLRFEGRVDTVHGPLVVAWATLPVEAVVRYELRAVHPTGPTESVPDPGLCSWLRHGYAGGTLHVVTSVPGSDPGVEDELLVFAVADLEILDGGGMFGCDLVTASVELVGGRWRPLVGSSDGPWQGELLGELGGPSTAGRPTRPGGPVSVAVEATLFGALASGPAGPVTVQRSPRR